MSLGGAAAAASFDVARAPLLHALPTYSQLVLTPATAPPADSQPVYAACKRLFSSLPLAAHIGQYTLVLHGGLFRRQPQRSCVGKNKRKRAQPLLNGACLD